MKKLIFIPICFILLLSNITKSQEVDTIYRLLYGHDYVDPDKKPYVDELLEVKWSMDIKKQFYPPVVIDGILFLYDNTEFAIDGKTGKKLYFDSKITQKYFQKTMKDSIIYIGELYNFIWVNLFTGEKYNVRKSLAKRLIYPVKDSTVYVFKDNDDDTLVAYNIFTEEIKWEFPYKPRFQYTTILDDKIILGDSKFVSCLDSKSGKELWSIKDLKFESNIIINDNELYCITRKNGLNVIDINTGEMLYELEEPYLRSILRSGNSIFFCRISDFVGFDMVNKKIIWKNDDSSVGRESNPGLVNDYIITYDDEVDMGGEIIAVNKNTGETEYEDWKTKRFTFSYDESDQSSEIKKGNSSLIFSEEWNNMIFATCTNDSLYCFQIKTPVIKE
ncbi:MAG: PQQ-binding-like beta-propeller repeat protein [Bacteroidales bacterium]|nr:PQQ-binding-like beta-propeller repeat protein [Bacteroidales bacterium]